MRSWWNGRHAALRGLWALARVSSSLIDRTILLLTISEKKSFFCILKRGYDLVSR